MNFNDAFKKVLIGDEGLKLKAYRCSQGFLTIGVGRNLETKGISREEAIWLLNNDIQSTYEDCLRLFGENFNAWSVPRQVGVASMVFNLGAVRFLNFRRMIRAIRVGDWALAAKEAKDSLWAVQVGTRDDRIVEMFVHERFAASYGFAGFTNLP